MTDSAAGLHSEPVITVGLIENAKQIRLRLGGPYACSGTDLAPGPYESFIEGNAVSLSDAAGKTVLQAGGLTLVPRDVRSCDCTLEDMAIGESFHWQRSCDLSFSGEIILKPGREQTLTVINRIPLERYLESVICSEMSPDNHPEYLKAHCIISRSWLIAQLARKKSPSGGHRTGAGWTDAAAHEQFDVCADDHCQRYHGIARVNAPAQAALRETRGRLLTFAGTVCDTRFSKCCGGITERFSTAWQDMDYPYLTPVADTSGAADFMPPLTGEAAAGFVHARPAVYCNASDPDLLKRLLPDFDRETADFFRWRVVIGQEELQDILSEKTGIRFGAIREAVPLRRGPSGRIYELRIIGEAAERVFGKELEVRRVLSRSHLYSSCFTVQVDGCRAGVPERFILHGAGWGHGVGLCQIGAAVMAGQGRTCSEILQHYFRGTTVSKLYQ